MELRVHKLLAGAVLPERKTDGSAGFDVCARTIPDDRKVIRPGKIAYVGTGLQMAFDSEYVALMFIRSSVANRGLRLVNSVAVFDSDYRGEYIMMLENITDHPITIEYGERIGQLVFTRALSPKIIEVEEPLDETGRIGGIGSTGRM